MAKDAQTTAIVPYGHGHKASLSHALLHVFSSFKNLGILGYVLEALLEFMHINKKANRKLRILHKPWMHLAAILMIIVGHLAEHVHQEEENHEQEVRIASLEKKLALLQAGKAANVQANGR